MIKIIISALFIFTSLNAFGIDYEKMQKDLINKGSNAYNPTDFCNKDDSGCKSQINNPSAQSYYTNSTDATEVGDADKELSDAGHKAFNNSDMQDRINDRRANNIEPDLTSINSAILDSYIKDAAQNKYADCKANSLGGGTSATEAQCYAQTGNPLTCTYTLTTSKTKTQTTLGSSSGSFNPRYLNYLGSRSIGGKHSIWRGGSLSIPNNVDVTNVNISGGCDRNRRSGKNTYLVVNGKRLHSGSGGTVGINKKISGGKIDFYYNGEIQGCSSIRVTAHYRKTIPILEWVNNCKKSYYLNQGCVISSSQCTQGAGERNIGGNKYNQNCWAKEEKYTCPANDTCKNLETNIPVEDLKAGETTCSATKKVCSLDIDGVCIQTKNTEKCLTKLPDDVSIDCGQAAYCTSDSSNPDMCEPKKQQSPMGMAEALTQLSLLKEFGEQFDENDMTFFTGQSASCSKVVGGIKDCCKDSGWGTDMGLAVCSTEEKDLAVSKGKNLTIEVGSYCAEKILGACIRRKKSYCLYTSQIAKITVMGAINQEGISLGSAKDPDCSGLSISTFQGIDFEKVDYSPIVGDITPQMPNLDDMKNNVKSQANDDNFSNGGQL